MVWQQRRGPKASKKALKSIRTIRIKEVPDCGEVLLQPALVNFKKKTRVWPSKIQERFIQGEQKRRRNGKIKQSFSCTIGSEKGA